MRGYVTDHPSARMSGSRERGLNPSQQSYGRAELPAAM